MAKLDIACIIDDDPLFTYVLSRQMKLLDFSEKILVFPNGLEALKYLQPVTASPDMLPSVICSISICRFWTAGSSWMSHQTKDQQKDHRFSY